jgi:glutathione S-transferase
MTALELEPAFSARRSSRRDLAIASSNPAPKVPTLVLDDNTTLVESASIARHQDGLGDVALLLPTNRAHVEWFSIVAVLPTGHSPKADARVRRTHDFIESPR